ncbi:hypothetical protein EDB83DRAFT_2357673 [Lactarius deliciosus]|nr:hypothetical protein EDB83DRAFT_2357673 [Lactarius deliciosus]
MILREAYHVQALAWGILLGSLCLGFRSDQEGNASVSRLFRHSHAISSLTSDSDESTERKPLLFRPPYTYLSTVRFTYMYVNCMNNTI